MEVREGFGLLTAIVVLAGVAVIVAGGGNTASILDSAGRSFGGLIRAATLQR